MALGVLFVFTGRLFTEMGLWPSALMLGTEMASVQFKTVSQSFSIASSYTTLSIALFVVPFLENILGHKMFFIFTGFALLGGFLVQIILPEVNL